MEAAAPSNSRRGGRSNVGASAHPDIAFVDLLKPADRRAVKPDPVLKAARIERARRDRKVLPQLRQIGEPQIDHCYLFVFDRLQHVFGRASL
jgi:hypothetical protein